MDAHFRAAVGGALAQARLESLDLVNVAGRLLGLGIGLLGVLVVGFDVLGHVFCLFS